MALPINLISTDFDGTLHAEHEDPPVPVDLQTMIAGMQAGGAKWVINTGRDQAGLLEAVARAQLSIQPDFLVVVEREIYRRDGAATSCSGVGEVVVEREIYRRDGARYVDLLPWNDQCRQAHARLFERVRADIPRLTDWVNAHYRAMVYEDVYSPFCIIAQSNGEMDAIQTFLEGYCAEVPGLAVMRNDVYSRFNHVDFNKGTALAEIGRHLGVPPEQTLAAGDHWNDLAMLSTKVARCLVAPDNAIEPIKVAVRSQNGYVSYQPCGHGVARGIEYYLGRAL